jgi:hypothetical protein
LRSFNPPLRPLVWLAVLLLSSKALQFVVDSRPLLFVDSAAFVMNALGLTFMPERSYVYSWLIRGCCLPFGSLVPLVALQALAGGAVAWLLGFALIRFLRVRWQIAMTAGLAFAWDPTQIVSERLVMTEASAGFTAALFFVTALEYLRTARIIWLPVLALLGTLLVSLRLLYIPLVFASAALLPVAAIPVLAGNRRRSLAIALGLSVTAVAVCQVGYRALTGWLANRKPAYQYASGFFLLAAVAPLGTGTGCAGLANRCGCARATP